MDQTLEDLFSIVIYTYAYTGVDASSEFTLFSALHIMKQTAI